MYECIGIHMRAQFDANSLYGRILFANDFISAFKFVGWFNQIEITVFIGSS